MPRRLTAIAAALTVVLGLGACSDGDGQNAPAAAASAAAGEGRERTYYIAADPVNWNYAPDGRNLISGKAFTADEGLFAAKRAGLVGPTFAKCLYRGYPDASFAAPQQRSEAEGHLGYLGPVIRAEVGDRITVVFRNNCSFPTSIHPHGVFYEKAHEGAGYADGTGAADHGDDAVAPGNSYTYRWSVPERAGPGPMDGSSAVWMYHGHRDEVGDVYAGLNGFLVVTAAGLAREDGSPEDVDREVFSLFLVADENASPLLGDNLTRVRGGRPDVEDEEFVESNLKHTINGFLYGNGPMVTLKAGDRVRWYLMAMGSEVDLHTPHWHGNTAVVHGMRTDVTNLLPAGMVTADLTADNVGTWLFHCHVADHIRAGMQSLYRVER
jgi:FtsP/CotA-like multicopper oxidase with cupredoxin domain